MDQTCYDKLFMYYYVHAEKTGSYNYSLISKPLPRFSLHVVVLYCKQWKAGQGSGMRVVPIQTNFHMHLPLLISPFDS